MEKKYYCDFVPQVEGNDATPTVERFFFMLSILINEGVIRGVQTFTNIYGINRRNLLHIRNDIAHRWGAFNVAWLTYLVRDFKVSATWLLTGEGELFAEGWSPSSIRIYRRAVFPRKEQKKSNTKKSVS